MTNAAHSTEQHQHRHDIYAALVNLLEHAPYDNQHLTEGIVVRFIQTVPPIEYLEHVAQWLHFRAFYSSAKAVRARTRAPGAWSIHAPATPPARTLPNREKKSAKKQKGWSPYDLTAAKKKKRAAPAPELHVVGSAEPANTNDDAHTAAPPNTNDDAHTAAPPNTFNLHGADITLRSPFSPSQNQREEIERLTEQATLKAHELHREQLRRANEREAFDHRTAEAKTRVIEAQALQALADLFNASQDRKWERERQVEKSNRENERLQLALRKEERLEAEANWGKKIALAGGVLGVAILGTKLYKSWQD